MNTKPDSTAYLMMVFFLMLPLIATAQSDRKATELKNLEKGITVARARVELNQKQLADADSLIKLGYQIVREGKAETRVIYSESDKIEKNYASKHKPLVKLSTSKDKAEAVKARADLKAVDAQYRADNIALETRLRSAERKQTAGASQIIRGKTSKLNARDALKTSTAALKAARKKYDVAASAETRKTK